MFLRRVEIKTDITRQSKAPDVVLCEVAPHQLQDLWPLSPDFLDTVPTQECSSFESGYGLMEGLRQTGYEQAGIFDLQAKDRGRSVLGLCGIRAKEGEPNAELMVQMLYQGKRAGAIITPTVVALATYAFDTLKRTTVHTQVSAASSARYAFEEAGFSHMMRNEDFDVVPAGPEEVSQTHWELWQLSNPQAQPGQPPKTEKDYLGWDIFRTHQALLDIKIR